MTRQRLFPGLALAAVTAIITATLTGVAARPAAAAPPADTAADPVPAPAVVRADVQPAQPLDAEQEALLRNQDQVLPAAQDLMAQAAAAESDLGGVEIDVASKTITVYRTDPSRPVRLTSATAIPDGVTVQVQQSRFNRATLMAMTGRITADAQALADEGVLVQGVGPANDGSGVAVSAAGDPADRAANERVTAALRGHYGDAVASVRLVSNPVGPQGGYFKGFRFNDFPAWFGGDRITDMQVGCTGGFGALLAGKPVMMTAAHCGEIGGPAWRNGPGTGGGFTTMGAMVFDDNERDIAAISVSSVSSFVNVGAAESPSQLPVNTWISPVPGQLVCQSGSFTGEVCGLKVVDTGQSQCDTWFIFCLHWVEPLADALNTKGSGAFAAGHGDSGGPVYVRAAGGTSGTAVGMVHGRLSDTAAPKFPAFFPDTMNCPAPEGTSPRCSSGFSFVHMPGH